MSLAYWEKYRGRKWCNRTLSRAVDAGLIKRPEVCPVCDRRALVIGHHDDYNKPLDVKWMCDSCHTRYHHTKPCPVLIENTTYPDYISGAMTDPVKELAERLAAK